MAESINWVHFTDLHLGLDDQLWLWPRTKAELFKDLEKLSRETDGWDLVFFTGDFVQAGKPTEYDQLNKDLEHLWKVLCKSGRTPRLCAVPGNHDLSRPPGDAALTKTLTQLWSTDRDLRLKFWRDPASEYRRAIVEAFHNYSNWLANCAVPTISGTAGIIPGDFGAAYSKGSIKLGIIGLNSTFLQLASGDFRGRLDLHASQINAVCDGDPDQWLKRRTASVLLTHQPPSWLTPESLEVFRRDIYPPGRFVVHFCGHQHEPEATDLCEAGGLPRRLRLGISLFGLETWDSPSPQNRIHGYSAGQFVFEDTGAFEKCWPRTTVKARHGGLHLCPDYSFTLQEGDCVITRFSAEPTDESPSVEPAAESTPHEGVADEPAGLDIQPIHLLDRPLDSDSARARLASAPRLALAGGPQHRYVRQEEQSQCEAELRRARAVWLVADWAAEDGFIGSCIDRFRDPNQPLDVFHVRCGDAPDIDAFEALFPQQLGYSLQSACALLSSIKDAFLVLMMAPKNWTTG